MNPSEFSKQVIDWQQRCGRNDLPWQGSGDPYRVWISEIMLQQTQVAKVIPYFNRFMARFPDLASLAAAAEDEVLHLWSGLGYYARARNLRKAAEVVQGHFSGRFPEAIEALESLPGIGRSTAGAILSLALGQSQPILDGNVKRVLARHFMVEGWPGRSAVAKRLWELTRQLTPQQEAAAYNQGMMDLGATICTRGIPRCDLCPLGDSCQAREQGRQLEFPEPRPAKTLPVRSTRMLLVQNGAGLVLLERRPPVGIWGGLWSLPECPPDTDLSAWCEAHFRAELKQIRELPARRHSFSHFHLDITPLELQLKSPDNCVMDAAARVWYNPAMPDERGLAAPVARIIEESSQARGESR